MVNGNRVAVSLGSGGARGYAHIGALEILQERGYDIIAIAGSSMGALVGGIAAAGKLEDYTKWVRSLNQREVWRLLDLTLSAPGAIRAERILAKMSEILDGARIETLPIAFTAVATDLNARREVWFNHGPVDTAIRASIAIPGFITPVVFNGKLLVDGGLLNPMPIEPTAVATADFTIGINLSGEKLPESGSPVKESSEHSAFEDWTSKLRQVTDSVRESERFKTLTQRFRPSRIDNADDIAGAITADPADPPIEEIPKDIGRINLLNLSFDAMSAMITRYRMASNPPDVLVDVPINAARTLDFHKADELIELGRRLMSKALDDAGR